MRLFDNKAQGLEKIQQEETAKIQTEKLKTEPTVEEITQQLKTVRIQTEKVKTMPTVEGVDKQRKTNRRLQSILNRQRINAENAMRRDQRIANAIANNQTPRIVSRSLNF